MNKLSKSSEGGAIVSVFATHYDARIMMGLLVTTNPTEVEE